MIRTTCVILFLGSIILLSGCETAGGFGKGVALTVEGAGKDTCNVFGALGAADDWMRKNLW